MHVTQVIPTIQCEQSNIGLPVLLIRFGGCNLKCNFCDSAYSSINYKIEKDIKDPYKLIIELLYKYPNINTLMFTGGEPFLHIKDMVYIFNMIKFQEFINIKNVIIETNGTLINIENLRQLNTFLINSNLSINISPKLNNEYFINNKDYNIIYDEMFENIYKFEPHCSITFKFVYDENYKDTYINFINKYNIKTPVFMPLTPNINLLDDNDFKTFYNNSCKDTIKFCLENGFHYSPREHITVFGKDNNESLE